MIKMPITSLIAFVVIEFFAISGLVGCISKLASGFDPFHLVNCLGWLALCLSSGWFFIFGKREAKKWEEFFKPLLGAFICIYIIYFPNFTTLFVIGFLIVIAIAIKIKQRLSRNN